MTVSYTFRDIPQGDYAAFVFHDENNNGILDTGLFHRPLEGRGYSEVLPQDSEPHRGEDHIPQGALCAGRFENDCDRASLSSEVVTRFENSGPPLAIQGLDLIQWHRQEKRTS